MKRKQFYIVVVCVCVLYKIFYSLSYILGSNVQEDSGIVVLRSYEKDFHYPLDITLEPLVAEIITKWEASVKPVNFYLYRYIAQSYMCFDLPQIYLLITVKSSIENFKRRDAIRKTYAKATDVKGKVVKTLFFVGIHKTKSLKAARMQSQVGREMEMYGDIVQSTVLDDYYDNTGKTMMMFRWLFLYCSKAKFSLFTNDDMYISPTNLLRYLSSWESKVNNTGQNNRKLLAGYVIPKFQPQRSLNEKWYISLEDYPWDAGPPFFAAGAFVVSSQAAQTIFAASLFVRHLSYVDVYIGIVAHKIGLNLTHCPQIHYNEKEYTRSNYKNVIASHGYHNPKKLIAIWNRENKQARSAKRNNVK